MCVYISCGEWVLCHVQTKMNCSYSNIKCERKIVSSTYFCGLNLFFFFALNENQRWIGYAVLWFYRVRLCRPLKLWYEKDSHSLFTLRKEETESNKKTHNNVSSLDICHTCLLTLKMSFHLRNRVLALGCRLVCYFNHFKDVINGWTFQVKQPLKLFVVFPSHDCSRSRIQRKWGANFSIAYYLMRFDRIFIFMDPNQNSMTREVYTQEYTMTFILPDSL